MAKTVAELLVERVVGWGVDTIFGFPGDGVNGIFEALRTHKDKLKFIQVRHEEAAAFAACGYAKYSGRLGVCIATSGPGGMHLLNGLYDAKCDGQPVLAITGHTFHDLIGTHYQQDVDLDKLYMDVAEFNQRIMGPGHVNNIVDEAIKTSLTRRTVSHITIPKDIQDWTSQDGERSKANIPKHSADIFAAAHPLPSQESLEAAAEIINRGSKIAILAGAGCLKARRLKFWSWRKKSQRRLSSPCSEKRWCRTTARTRREESDLLGTAPSQDALKECETLIIAGSGFPYMEFYPEPGQAKGVQIDIDPARIGLRHPVDVGLTGDCREVLRALLPLIRKKKDQDFLKSAQKNMTNWNRLMEERGNAQG